MASAWDWHDRHDRPHRPNSIDIGNQHICNNVCVDNIRINYS
jgi:hypothetical protein